MTKTRKDVGKTYLSDIMKKSHNLIEAKELYQASNMEIAEFYKQLREEMAQGLIVESKEKGRLELVHAA